MCFAAGTLIDTPLGPRPIEQLEVGEQVLGYDEALQAIVTRPVTARMQHADASVGQLVLGDGRTIVTTPNHPFYDAGEGRYRPAEELRPDAELLSLSHTGRLSSATNVGYFMAAEPVRATVFNIEVAGVHNYFADGVLVHNKSPIDPCAGLSAEPNDLSALTSSEHARSVTDLTGVQIEPFLDRGARSHHGQSLPALFSYDTARLDAIATAAKAASLGPSIGVSCEANPSDLQECALAFIDDFVARAYRRPLRVSERTRYLGLFNAALAGSDLDTAIRLLAEAALRSPHFLYKVELTNGRLSDHELATRLSYFLTGLPPDAELRASASAGTLTRDWSAQVDRLAASPYFVVAMQELYASWLGLDRLHASETTSDELVEAMRAETVAFFDWHVSADVPVASLLTEPVTFVDPVMANHYGLPAPTSGRERVVLEPSRYSGALTQASFMTAFPRPTWRGTWIMQRLLCTEPPPPPPNVEAPPPLGPGEDSRAWIEQATADSVCQACHKLIDPHGFAFQSFDELGRWRSANDASSVHLARGDVDVDVQGAASLVSALLSSEPVLDCAKSHWLAWALKRPLDARMACELEQESSTSNLTTTRQLVKEIVGSDAFLNGHSAAISVDDDLGKPFEPALALDTEAARSSAARDLVKLELEILLQKLPNDAGLSSYSEGLR